MLIPLSSQFCLAMKHSAAIKETFPGTIVEIELDMKKAIIFCQLLSLLSAPAWASLACEDVFHKVPNKFVNKVAPEAYDLAESLTILGQSIKDAQNPPEPTASWWMRTPPKRSDKLLIWENFEALDRVQKDVEKYALKLKTMNPEQLAKERRRALIVFDQYPEIQIVFEYLAQTYPKDYIPTEYDIKRDFLLRILKISRALPPEFRPSISRIPKDSRIAKINADARAFMKRQDAQFRNIFTSTGFKDYATFEKELRSSQNPVVQDAIKLIDSDSIELVIRRPMQGRFWIPKVGIQNQYVSGSSKGLLDKESRFLLESTMSNERYETYAKQDNEFKPKYGTLDIAPNHVASSDLNGSRQYGGDIYYLKKDMVADRVSFYPGDSLNQYAFLKRAGTWTKDSWRSLLIPWKNRMMMVPFMVQGLSYGKFDRPILDAPITEKFNLPQLKGWSSGGREHTYWEFQIFGRVDLSMVKAFKFMEDPPTGEFLETLKHYNIEIIDGRQNRGE